MDTSLRQQAREPNGLIGGQIRAARGLRGWSQHRLASELGVSFQQVQKYEKGKNRVAACTLVRIASLLSLDVGFFMAGTATPIGRGELEMIRVDIGAALAAIDVAMADLDALRTRLRSAAQRMEQAERIEA